MGTKGIGSENGDAKTKHRNLYVRMSSEDFLEIFFKDYFFTAVLGSHQNWKKGIDIREKNFFNFFNSDDLVARNYYFMKAYKVKLSFSFHNPRKGSLMWRD